MVVAEAIRMREKSGKGEGQDQAAHASLWETDTCERWGVLKESVRKTAMLGGEGILIKARAERRKLYVEMVNRSQTLEANCIQPLCDQQQKVTIHVLDFVS